MVNWNKIEWNAKELKNCKIFRLEENYWKVMEEESEGSGRTRGKVMMMMMMMNGRLTLTTYEGLHDYCWNCALLDFQYSLKVYGLLCCDEETLDPPLYVWESGRESSTWRGTRPEASATSERDAWHWHYVDDDDDDVWRRDDDDEDKERPSIRASIASPFTNI